MADAPSFITYNGDGIVTDFTFPFPYIDPSHIHVLINGVEVAFAFVSANIIRLTPGYQPGVIRIERVTPATPLVTWSDGAVILGKNLNTATIQPAYVAQEATDKADEAEATAENAVAIANAAVSDAGVQADRAEQAADDAEAARDAAQGFRDEAQTQANTAATATAATLTSTFEGLRDETEGFRDQAAVSATTAAAQVVAAQAVYDTFDDRYLGAKASDPTKDNDGNPLVVGAVYFNSTDDTLKVWAGTIWVTSIGAVAPHTHPISDIIGLQSALDGKAALVHTHAISDVNGLQTALDEKLALTGGTLTGPLKTDTLVYTRSKALANGTDLNTVTDAGFYDGTALVNAPDATNGYYVEVIRYNVDNTFVFQRAHLRGAAGTPPRLYMRCKCAGTWGSWALTPTSFDTQQVFTGGVNIPEKFVTNTSGQTITLNPGNGPIQAITNNGAGTFVGPSVPNTTSNGSFLLVLTNGSTAGALTFQNYSTFGDTISTTASAVFALYVYHSQLFNWIFIKQLTG